MKKVYFGVAALCAGAWMASCGGNKVLMSSSELGGEWNIVTVAGEQTTGCRSSVWTWRQNVCMAIPDATA